MLLSFITLWLQVLTAIWQCQAVTTDAMSSKGHSFIPHIKQVLIFHSLQKNIKKERGFLSAMPNATQNVIGDNVELRTDTEHRVKWILKPVYLL